MKTKTKIKAGGCLVEHVDWSGSGGEDEPFSNVSFAYAKVT